MIATLNEVKAWLGIPEANTEHDAVLNLIMDSTEESIKHYCATDFTLTEMLGEVLDGNGSDTIIPSRYPINSVQKVTFGTKPNGTEGSEVSVDYYQVKEDAIILQGLVTPFGRSNIAVDYKYGYDGVPKDVKLAFIQAVEAIFRRKGRKTIGMASRSKGDESEGYKGDIEAWDGLTGLPKEIVYMLKPYKSFEFPTQPMATRNT